MNPGEQKKIKNLTEQKQLKCQVVWAKLASLGLLSLNSAPLIKFQNPGITKGQKMPVYL